MGVVMRVYLDETDDGSQLARTHYSLRGWRYRWVRQKMMTVTAIVGGLLYIMWRTDVGAKVMKRIAVPKIGGR